MPELSLGFTPKLKFPGKIDSMCGEQILNPAQILETSFTSLEGMDSRLPGTFPEPKPPCSKRCPSVQSDMKI